MEIISRVHDLPLTTDDISIFPSDQGYAATQVVLARAKKLRPVKDAATQNAAGDVAAELQGLCNGIQVSYDEVKAPYLAATRRLDRIFHEWHDPLHAAYRKVTGMIAIFRDEQRREQELAKAHALAEQRAREAAERQRLEQLEHQRRQAEMKARLAEEAREKAEAERTAKALQAAVAHQQIVVDLQNENLPIANIAETPKLVGGRDYVHYDVELVNWHKVPAEYQDRILKVAIRLLPAQQLARELDEQNKLHIDADGLCLTVPGLRIRKQSRVSVQGATAIRVSSPEEI